MKISPSSWKPCLLPFLISVLLVSISTCDSKKKCRHSITKQDAVKAVLASDAVYWDHHMYVGNYIPGTTFRIENIVEPSVYGESLRCVVASSRDTVIIAFRGTRTPQQLLHQYLSLFNAKQKLRFGGKTVHVLPYFWKAVRSFNITALLPDVKKNKKYIVTGHSLGGAIASLFSLHMKKHRKALWENPGSCLITFGAPRVGDHLYAKTHDKLIHPNRKIRFIYGNDVAAHLPPRPHFVHHSRALWIHDVKEEDWWWGWPLPTYKTYWSVCGLRDSKSRCNDINVLTTPTHQLMLWFFMYHPVWDYVDAVTKQPDGYYNSSADLRKTFRGAFCE